jgi:hypothetical protein
MKRFYVSFVINLMISPICANTPKPYNLSFKQYKETQVPKALKNKFHRFYNKMLDKTLALKESNKALVKSRNEKIRCVGMRRIEKMHPETFRDIADKLTRPETPKSEKKKIERYILREGYLNEFIKSIARSEKTVWGLTKKYTQEGWNKIKSGFTNTYDNLTKAKAKPQTSKKLQSSRRKKSIIKL